MYLKNTDSTCAVIVVIPYMDIRLVSRLSESVFCAFTSVGALFLFWGTLWKREQVGMSILIYMI